MNFSPGSMTQEYIRPELAFCRPRAMASDPQAAKAAIESAAAIAALKRSTPTSQKRACWGPRRCATQNPKGARFVESHPKRRKNRAV